MDQTDFEKWMTCWDNAQKEIAAEQPPVAQESPLRTSYFTGAPSHGDYHQEDDVDGSDWHNIYHRAMEIDYREDGLITDAVNVAYMGSEGYGKHIEQGTPPTPGGKKVYTNNPIHFASVGTDQESEDGPVRVTKNWSDGEELRELDYIKRQVEQLERRYHDADVLKQSQKTKLESELSGLRERVKKLSEKLTPTPQTDLT